MAQAATTRDQKLLTETGLQELMEGPVLGAQVSSGELRDGDGSEKPCMFAAAAKPSQPDAHLLLLQQAF